MSLEKSICIYRMNIIYIYMYTHIYINIPILQLLISSTSFLFFVPQLDALLYKVTLAASGGEGGRSMGAMRWAQTANYGVAPNPAMPRTSPGSLARSYVEVESRPFHNPVSPKTNCCLGGQMTQIFFMFTSISGKVAIWLWRIFFKWVETTN